MRFTKKVREETIREYMSETGANQYNAGEFVAWVQGNPDHPVYEWFERRHAWDEERAAHEHRLLLARQFTAGVHVSFSVETVGRGGAVKVSMHTIPAMVSPLDTRRTGGGYDFSNPDDPESMDEICLQASKALEWWCDKYEGAAAYRGANVNALRKLIDVLTPAKEEAA